ncbi:MAG: HAMP domain-containing histidine kinase [Bdellovibrionales bacterium]|nr:HAMP domain-containing histidine kinase [Bdellovibrionales bacterium]
MLIWVIVCQLVFYFIQHNHGLDLSRALQSQFRSDLFSSDFEYLLRSVGDLEKLATIRCPVVEQIEPRRRILLDLSFRGDCIQNSWLLSGGQFSAKVRAINNDLFVVSFSTRNQIVFLWGLWAMRLGGLIFFSTIYFVQRLRNVQNDQLAKLRLEAAQTLTSLAAQVSHDIRSPLSALNLAVSTLQGWPDMLEEQRHLIRKATQRINDIANDLLNKSKVPDFGIPAVGVPDDSGPNIVGKRVEVVGPSGPSGRSGPSEPSDPILIADLLDSVIREKRLQFCENPNLEIHLDLREGFGFFAVISAVELSRVISNLINNSVEASVNSGRITIAVRRYADQGQGAIVVSDQGRGISPEVLERIRAWGPSMSDHILRIGGPQIGTGLGLHHARQTLARAGGEFSIHSREGVGTIVTLLLPCTEEPRWFARRIKVPQGAVVVSVDDDPSIHQIWAMRLSSAERSKSPHIILYSKASAMKWILEHRDLDCVYLIDFEFLGEPGDGLDLIAEAGIAAQSILVTSRYEEPHVRSRSLALGVRLLPKSLAAFVPLSFFNRVQNDTESDKAIEKSPIFS